MSSLVELIDAFHSQRIGEEEFLAGLDKQIQFATRKLAEVDKQRIAPEDQALWEAELKPGLQAVYEGVIGAATEAREYARSRKEETLHGVGILLVGIDQVMEILAQRSGLVSASTQQALEDALGGPGDGVSLKGVNKGTAESAVSFLD